MRLGVVEVVERRRASRVCGLLSWLSKHKVVYAAAATASRRRGWWWSGLRLAGAYTRSVLVSRFLLTAAQRTVALGHVLPHTRTHYDSIRGWRKAENTGERVVTPHLLVPTKEQIADLFTKPLDKTTFLYLRSLLMTEQR